MNKYHLFYYPINNIDELILINEYYYLSSAKQSARKNNKKNGISNFLIKNTETGETYKCCFVVNEKSGWIKVNP